MTRPKRKPSVFILASAACLLSAQALADVVITRGRDGTVTVTNVPSRRAGTTVVARAGRGTGLVSTSSVGTTVPPPGVGTGLTAPTTQPAPNAQVQALYLAAARDGGRFSRYDVFIREASTLYQIPEPLVRAVIKQESDYNPYSVSSAGAAGLMQLMPEVARSMNVHDVFDARQSILGGVRFLRILANMFNGDLVLTIAAYNAGPNAVIRYAGVPPYDETQHYVRQVLRFYYMFRAGSLPASDPSDTPASRAVSAHPSRVDIRVDPHASTDDHNTSVSNGNVETGAPESSE